MYCRFNIFSIILFSLISVISACSNGPAEKPLPDSITSPAHLLDQGVQQYNINDYARAINYFEKALLQYRSIDSQAGIANSCMNLANTYMAINNNQTAAQYLIKANAIIKQSSLTELEEHLHLLNSSLAINNDLFDEALQELNKVLNSENRTIQLAALKNRTSIAFIRNATDRDQWLEKYRTLQQNHPVDTPSHLARILRFEAELNHTENYTAEPSPQVLLSQALTISGNRADRPAIAATLAQWAQLDISAENLSDAEDKYLRALFIRHQLGDVKNSLLILEKLQSIYAITNDEKQKQTENWITRISGNDLADWQQLFSDFDTYPEIK